MSTEADVRLRRRPGSHKRAGTGARAHERAESRAAPASRRPCERTACCPAPCRPARRAQPPIRAPPAAPSRRASSFTSRPPCLPRPSPRRNRSRRRFAPTPLRVYCRMTSRLGHGDNTPPARRRTGVRILRRGPPAAVLSFAPRYS
ncbi:hypothetical protein CF647_07470 [Burkholderia sp. 117]|nr:hypothetical protein BOC43_25100 [Burkholderia pseudomallei]PNX04998.1 hypothetical protein CF649_07570 [Burkholderia sp. 136(2017)]PNX16235.1 hypothetical protein CF650_09015 [Burkholderia sp. 129]PNX31789.1 hypothetical protein CF647_07470 [Burkholderia sp. 117]PNX40699.1 hypothetical protein CF648_07565 [Burkholderia sp. 137]